MASILDMALKSKMIDFWKSIEVPTKELIFGAARVVDDVVDDLGKPGDENQ